MDHPNLIAWQEIEESYLKKLQERLRVSFIFSINILQQTNLQLQKLIGMKV